MYTPPSFAENRLEVLSDFIRQHSFGALQAGGAAGLRTTRPSTSAFQRLRSLLPTSQ